MNDVATLLVAFREATGREAAVWQRPTGASAATLQGGTSPAFVERTAPGLSAWDVPAWARSNGCVAHLVSTGDWVGWLIVEPGDESADRLLGRLLPWVQRTARERDGATAELAERYEEITLLYTIGEVLGGSTSVESVAGALVRELALTVGATRAAFLLADADRRVLEPIATLGGTGTPYGTVPIDDPVHVAARAFRRAGSCVEVGSAAARGDPVLAADAAAVLAVAITRAGSPEATWARVTGEFSVLGFDAATPVDAFDPTASGPQGVLVLAGPRPFSAGDRKLVTAVVSQIGTALDNARLVRVAVERDQLAREMRLAHDLQLKLLPDPAVVGPEARAAARVIAAESVGGDFYLLARLDAERTAVLVGDVSGHGYQAALVMALALSAAAIHVQRADDPALTIDAVRRSLDDELASTEMSLSLCYAVIDARRGEVRYANAGHPHAFRLAADGTAERLAALGPALGFATSAAPGAVVPWRAGDRLLLFTDGVADALDPMGRRLGETAVLCAAGVDGTPGGVAAPSPAETVERIVDRVRAHIDGAPLRDDVAVVVVDRAPGGPP